MRASEAICAGCSAVSRGKSPQNRSAFLRRSPLRSYQLMTIYKPMAREILPPPTRPAADDNQSSGSQPFRQVSMPEILNLHTGDLVEVRSKAEILSTLDQNGRLEDLPFMPEMLRYCGQRFRVYKRAHKTCDFVTHTGIRKLSNAVHLEGLRCDGSAHGCCQAQCLIFWKEAWLRRVREQVPAEDPRPTATAENPKSGTSAGAPYTEEDVWKGT